MVNVFLGILELKVMGHPHQAPELDAIVPVAETHSQFPHHVLQRVNVGPIFLWSSCDWDGEGFCWIISLQPADAFLEESMLFQIFSHCAFPSASLVTCEVTLDTFV